MADLVSYALVSLADVKETLGISSGVTTNDNLLTRKINQATDMIESYCGRRFAATTYTDEVYDATNTDQVILRQRPVTAVASFSVRDSVDNSNSWELINTTDYFLHGSSGLLNLLFTFGGKWSRGKVSYTAGYTTIPSDLAEACAMLAAYLFQNSTSGSAVKSKQEGSRKIEYYDTSTSNNSLFKQLGLDDMLAPYINDAIYDGR